MSGSKKRKLNADDGAENSAHTRVARDRSQGKHVGETAAFSNSLAVACHLSYPLTL